MVSAEPLCSASGKVITCTNTGLLAAVTLTLPVVPASTNTGVATNSEISKIALYQGTTLLDEVSGSDLSNGTVTFNDFDDINIAANATEAFSIKIDVVDSVDAVANSPITASLISISAKDDDNDDVIVVNDDGINNNGNDELGSTPIIAPFVVNILTSNKAIAVTNAGVLAVIYDTNNDDNEDPKTVLAGSSQVVGSVDVQATNEEIDVETVIFTVNTDLTSAITSASLYLDDSLVATNSSSDISSTQIKFDNLTNLVIPEETAELRLELNTANIGYQEVGKTIINAQITNVALSDLDGVQSGKTVANVNAGTFTGEFFSIVPATVTPSIVSTFGGESKVKITVDTGTNKQQNSNSTPVASIATLTFSELGNTLAADYATAYVIYKDGDSANQGACTNDGTTVVCTLLSAVSINNDETFVVKAQGSVNITYALKLQKDGVSYTTSNTDVNNGGLTFTSNMTDELDLGSKTY